MKFEKNINSLIVLLKGGIGNQLFQYAFYENLKSLGHAVKLDLSWFEENQNRSLKIWEAFDLPFSNGDLVQKKYSFYNNVKPSRAVRLINKLLLQKSNIKLTDIKKKEYVICENDIFYPEAYTHVSKGYLDGYWQSELFFSNIKFQIKDIFKFNQIYNKSVLKIRMAILKSKHSTSIHWRRGDYVGHKILGLNLDDYFKNALKTLMMHKTIKDIFVFTEDTEWVKKRICDYDLNLNYYFVSENLKDSEDFHELYLMSQCENNIISNSTFSWWAAYLNQNPKKTVLAPNKWTNFEYQIKFKNILPKDWISVKVD